MYVNACGVLVKLTGVGCCPSCGFDEADGYDMIEIESPSCRTVSTVCCVHTEPVERDQRRVWWAILLRASRAQRAATGDTE